MTKTEIKGIDVSHHNGVVDWNKVAAAGYTFAIVKATEHTRFVDPKFKTNWKRVKEVGLLRGAYHFAKPGKSGAVAQAEHFARTIGELDEGDLGPVLDLEDAGAVPPLLLVRWTQDFLDRLEELTGRTPIFYSGPGFWSQLGNTTQFTRYPLWQAQYGPRARKFGGWPCYTIWQYTSEGTVPGVGGNCDVNRFKGTLSDLHELAGVGDVALSPELKSELDKIHTELAALKKSVDNSYAVLERGDHNPAPGDQMPQHFGITDVIKRIDLLEKKIVKK